MSKFIKTWGTIAALVLVAGVVSAETYTVDTKTSQVKWLGKKVTGQHDGTVDLKSGELTVTKGKVVGGKIEIDMSSIKVLDITDPETNGKLVGHLKSDDFFSVEKNPTALFTIASVQPIAGGKPGEPNSTVSGSLSIKGMTHPLSFPATIVVTKGALSATATAVKVDRTLYDIRYGSGKFFQGLGDKVINDEFLLDFALSARK